MEAESSPSGRRVRGQNGETLIESLVALVILLVVGLAAASGMFTITDASAQHRESAVAETLLRTSAERLQDPDSEYVDWAGCDGAPGDNYTDLPTADGYDVDPPTVEFWIPPDLYSAETVPTDPVMTSFGPCPGTLTGADGGLQRITLTVSTPSGGSETITFLKRRS